MKTHILQVHVDVPDRFTEAEVAEAVVALLEAGKLMAGHAVEANPGYMGPATLVASMESAKVFRIKLKRK